MLLIIKIRPNHRKILFCATGQLLSGKWPTIFFSIPMLSTEWMDCELIFLYLSGFNASIKIPFASDFFPSSLQFGFSTSCIEWILLQPTSRQLSSFSSSHSSVVDISTPYEGLREKKYFTKMSYAISNDTTAAKQQLKMTTQQVGLMSQTFSSLFSPFRCFFFPASWIVIM